MMRSTLGPMASRTAFEGEEVDLGGIVALGHGLLGLAGVVVRGALGDDVGAPAELQLAGVGAQLFAALTAQQLVDGGVVVLALDVPERNIDGRDSGEDHRAAILAPEGGAVQLIPDDLMLQRVHADDELGKVLYDAERCDLGLAVGQSGFTVAVDAFVGVDAADDGAPVAVFQIGFQMQDVNLCDFHRAKLLS